MTTFSFRNENGAIAVVLKTDEALNAWEGTIAIPKDGAKGILTEGGITDLWQTSPRISAEEIIFAGGSFEGFKGEGVIFRILPGSGGRISFTAARAYFADGKGTEAKVETASITAAEGVAVADTLPPEPFRVEKYRSRGIFDGKPVVIWNATDSGSGIARYEIKEITTAGEGPWHEAQSPYLINPDVRSVTVRAVDNFGNIREESIALRQPLTTWLTAIFILAAILVYVIRYTKRVR